MSFKLFRVIYTYRMILPMLSQFQKLLLFNWFWPSNNIIRFPLANKIMQIEGLMSNCSLLRVISNQLTSWPDNKKTN